MPISQAPAHPGLILRDDVLPALAVSVTEAAERLGVARPTLSRVLNGRAAISPAMALRIEAWIGVDRGGRAEVWIERQGAYDLWRARTSASKAPDQRDVAGVRD